MNYCIRYIAKTSLFGKVLIHTNYYFKSLKDRDNVYNRLEEVEKTFHHSGDIQKEIKKITEQNNIKYFESKKEIIPVDVKLFTF